ncbi:hypothetical protein OAL67_00865 [bacterium]|nr:hypothetical protein [bacterium]
MITPKLPQKDIQNTNIRNKKSFWIFLHLLIVILFLGTISYLTYQNKQLNSKISKFQCPSNTITDDTQKKSVGQLYIEEPGGFTIKYPSSWNTKDFMKAPGMSRPNNTLVNMGFYGPLSHRLLITVSKDTAEFTFQDNMARFEKTAGWYDSSVQNTTLGGEKAYRLDYIYTQDSRSQRRIEIIAQKGTRMYGLFFLADTGVELGSQELDNILTVVEQMIESFSFIEM